MSKKCNRCGELLRQGGCFQTIYEFCPKCEGEDTQPMTDPEFRLVTPTKPMWLPVEWDIDFDGD